jgi:transcriptional regulator with XRE-family HTH domain
VDEYTAALGAVVRAEVAAQSLSTTDVEERLGVSYPSYRRYFITGGRSPSIEQLRSVAVGLGMSGPVELLQRVEARIKRGR